MELRRMWNREFFINIPYMLWTEVNHYLTSLSSFNNYLIVTNIKQAVIHMYIRTERTLFFSLFGNLLFALVGLCKAADSYFFMKLSAFHIEKPG